MSKSDVADFGRYVRRFKALTRGARGQMKYLVRCPNG